MPRNRMIKPDFWDDEKMSQLSRDARLVFIALWNFSDDYAVVKGNHVWLKNHIFPYDDNLELPEFEAWLKELAQKRRIIPFNHNKERYYFITNFEKHQTINRPSQQRNPEPPDDILEDSRNTHGIFTDEMKRSEEKLSIKEVEAFSLPSQQQINESSIPKVKTDLDKICEVLYNEKIFPKVHAFKNQMLKQGKNERAILHTLSRCYIKKTFKDGPWAYCVKIIQIENGNFNERDYLKTCPTSS